MKQRFAPVDDVNLPSYVRPELLELKPELELLHDCWRLMKGVKQKYIPKEKQEPVEAYRSRLQGVAYVPTFNKAIKAYVGLLSQFITGALPKTLNDNIENVNNLGNNLEEYMAMADTNVLRDGGVYIYTDYPPIPEGATSAADTLGRNPYYVLIPRERVINWITEIVDGVEVLQLAVIQETVADRSGVFGHTTKEVYRALYPGRWELYELVEDDTTDSGWNYRLLDFGETGLDYIPLRWYPSSPNMFGMGDAPFYSVAELSIEYLQKRSNLNELIRKLMLPVPVRKGMIVGGLDASFDVPPLVIGPNSAIDLPMEGDFFFASPASDALVPARQDLDKLESLMKEFSFNFISGGNNRTATEVLLDSAANQSALSLMGEIKESVVSNMVKDWVAYTGESMPTEYPITVDKRLLQPPLEPAEVQQLLAAVISEKLSLETFLTMLRDGKVLPDSIDIQEEISRIKSDQEENIAASVEKAMAESSTKPDYAAESNAVTAVKSIEQIPSNTNPFRNN